MRIRKWISFSILLTVLWTTIIGHAQPEVQCSLRIRGTERVNVRQEPTRSSPVLKRIELNQIVIATDKRVTPEGSWYFVDGGWVASWLVEPNGSALAGYLVVKLTGSPYQGAFDIEIASHTYAGTVCPEVIHGTDEADILLGNDGNDVLIGYGGNDTISGDLGDDVLFGGSGDDLLNGGSGLNYIYGMAGADRVISLASENDYFLLDGFAPHGRITESQVAIWFGDNVMDRYFEQTGIVGDLIVTRNFVFWGQPR